MNDDMPIGVAIAQIRQIQGRIAQKLLKKYERAAGIKLGEAQMNILYRLWQKDGVSISDIARRTNLANTTLTNMIDRLERQGLVKRERNKSNRREYIITLTDSSREIQNDYVGMVSQLREINFKGFSEEEIGTMRLYLKRIMENLEKWEDENI